jgi:hypothetical protein
MYDPSNPYPTHLGTTLDIGIPCIVSSKRKRFKALAKYIGRVEGEGGFWVGVEVPLSSISSRVDSYYGDPISGASKIQREEDERQWNDGSWGGIRYFSVHSSGAGQDQDDHESVYDDGRPSRRRRLDGKPGFRHGTESRGLKRGMSGTDSLGLSAGGRNTKRMRMRAASPSGSERSDTDGNGGGGGGSRGLFVRPNQVLYVVDAIDGDL